MFIINIIFVLREHNFLSQRRWSWHQRGYCKRQLKPANTKLTTNTRKLLNEGPLFSSYYLFAFVCKCAACFCFPRYCCNVLLLLLLLLFLLYIFFFAADICPIWPLGGSQSFVASIAPNKARRNWPTPATIAISWQIKARGKWQFYALVCKQKWREKHSSRNS